MTAYVTTTMAENEKDRQIIVFETKEQVAQWAKKVFPLQVLCSEYPTIKAAKKQAKIFHKLTPWMKLILKCND